MLTDKATPIIVITIESMAKHGGKGMHIETFATLLFDQWQIGQMSLDRLCQQLTEGFHQGDSAAAICGVIAEAGKQLSSPLPRAAGDVNELQDTLVLID